MLPNNKYDSLSGYEKHYGKLVPSCLWGSNSKSGGEMYLFQFFHSMDMERVLKEAFLEYDGLNLGKENCNYMRVRVQIDVTKPLKRKK
ncbi:hypothetical protein Goarm_022265 [Gossypium armourianum]|uniref:Uncharacterized protein n=1 Tax=Gossypium armourianum TaxID=34283 RepID=A0A7J9KGT3_9ROSI|nr:hypothetical protein [Gossypium armourianum]